MTGEPNLALGAAAACVRVGAGLEEAAEAFAVPVAALQAALAPVATLGAPAAQPDAQPAARPWRVDLFSAAIGGLVALAIYVLPIFVALCWRTPA